MADDRVTTETDEPINATGTNMSARSPSTPLPRVYHDPLSLLVGVCTSMSAKSPSTPFPRVYHDPLSLLVEVCTSMSARSPGNPFPCVYHDLLSLLVGVRACQRGLPAPLFPVCITIHCHCWWKFVRVCQRGLPALPFPVCITILCHGGWGRGGCTSMSARSPGPLFSRVYHDHCHCWVEFVRAVSAKSASGH